MCCFLQRPMPPCCNRSFYNFTPMGFGFGMPMNSYFGGACYPQKAFEFGLGLSLGVGVVNIVGSLIDRFI